MGLFLGSFSLRMGQFSNPVATHPRTNEAEVPPEIWKVWDHKIMWNRSFLKIDLRNILMLLTR